MKKHLEAKALLLLVVILFHSFVLVPVAHATTWEGVAGRLAFRAFAPSAIAALGSGTALVIGAVVAGGVGYLVYKSGAVTALKNWLTAQQPQNSYYMPVGSANGPTWVRDGTSRYLKNSSATVQFPMSMFWSSPSYAGGAWQFGGTIQDAAALATFMASSQGPNAGNSTSPQDYVNQMASAQPNFGNTDVYGSPGAAAAIVGGAAIVSATTMSDSDADSFINGLGGTAISDAGAQTNPSGVGSNDNTITAGDSAVAGLLSSMLNYLSNLLGIKTAVESTKTATDCVASGVATMSTAITAQGAKLDNIASISASQAGKLDNIVSVGVQQRAALDNIAAMTQTQTTAINDVKTKVEHLDNAVTQSVATSSTVATRLDALKTAAASKFPFSLVASLGATVPSGTSHYEFGSLPLTPSISIPIEPMAGPLATLFGWIRQLLVWFFWAGTLLAMLRRSMEM